jgi:16S rRNA (cytosine967-C5)-methyltransferase
MSRETRTHSPNRLRHLYRLWNEYCLSEEPYQLDRWIARNVGAERRFGKNDRRFYSDALFAAARHGACAYALSVISDENKIEDDVLCERFVSLVAPLCGWQSYRAAFASVNEEIFFAFVFLRAGIDLESGRYGELYRLARMRCVNSSRACMTAWYGVPAWIGNRLEARVGNEWDINSYNGFIRAHETRPPLWIRINDPAYREEIVRDCSEHGFTIIDETGGAVAIQGQSPVFELSGYKKGLFEIQDYASQMIGRACDIVPGLYVWDACAGGGGKTIQIGALLSGKGAVYASDVRQYKLDETRTRARKAHLSNVRFIEWDGSSLPRFPKEIESRGGFHRVLVDAPCSASGTMRRNPDVKMRITPESVDELAELQLSILNRISGAVRDGGLLVYATCSCLPSENEDVVRAFSGENPSYELISMTLHGCPVIDSDTTFTAVLRKKANI